MFEAPIDFLSFLTLYPKDWQKHSYIVLNGVAEHAMLQMLCDYPQIDTVSFCLDYDPAGIENSYRLAEIAKERYPKIKLERLMSVNKDWNEDLKAKNGEKPIPGRTSENRRMLGMVWAAKAGGRKHRHEICHRRILKTLSLWHVSGIKAGNGCEISGRSL